MQHHQKQFAAGKHFPCKAAVLAALLCLLLTFLMPLALLLTGRIKVSESARPLFPFAEPVPEAAPETLTGPPSAGTRDSAVELKVLLNGETRSMDLGTYLWGVVAAEMPASFEQEALRAQAVAARTYTYYRMAEGCPFHPDAHICGDPGCCQAWMDYETRMADWGADAQLYADKVTEAIRSTDGMALYYGGAPILAAFHAASAGARNPRWRSGARTILIYRRWPARRTTAWCPTTTAPSPSRRKSSQKS